MGHLRCIGLFAVLLGHCRTDRNGPAGSSPDAHTGTCANTDTDPNTDAYTHTNPNSCTGTCASHDVCGQLLCRSKRK